MKRLTYFWTLVLCPLMALSMSQQAQISLNVVAVDPLSYNVRPLPTSSNQNQGLNNLSANNSTATSKLPICQKTIYFNQVPYQITGLQSQKGTSCSIDSLGGQSYSIMLTAI